MESINMLISTCIDTITKGKIPIKQPIKIYTESKLLTITEYSLMGQTQDETKQYEPLVVKSQDISFLQNQELTQLINE